MTPPPLLRDVLALAAAMRHTFGTAEIAPVLRDPLVERLLQRSLDLIEQITLCLADRDPWERLAAADATQRMLRSHLALSYEVGLIDEEPLLAYAERLDAIGRQIGGWQRRLAKQALDAQRAEAASDRLATTGQAR